MNRIIVIILGCLLTQNMVFAQTPTFHNDKNWQLKLEDNFDTLNTNVWDVRDNFDHGGGSTVHIASNVYLNNGTLVLRAKREYGHSYCCPSFYLNQYFCKKQLETGNCYKYTGAWIETKPAYNTKYGYAEAKIKMTYRAGVGYAFWTVIGINLSQASNAAEIDILETMVPRMKQAKNTIATNVHTCYNTINPGCERPFGENHSLPNFNYEDWHIYSVDWDADKITWYVDGSIIRTIQNRNLDNFGNSIVDPVKIILGSHANPDRILDNSSFEEYMYVDYVKVYQLKYDCNTVVNEIPNFNAYCYTVKKSISLSGATTIPPNSNISLRATDFIELKPGFEVPLGAELYLGVNPCSGPNYNCPPSPY